MRVIVTGGSGKLGQACVADLQEHGHQVIVLDRTGHARQPNKVINIDLTDFGQVMEAFLGIDSVLGVDTLYRGVDAVVHLGAIPGAGHTSSSRTYANNSVSSYNVFQAAKRAGIRNVVWASSETLLGLPFDVAPPMLPVTEEDPPRPESAYALGKLVDETIAREFCRWDPDLKMIALRFSNIMAPSDYDGFPGFEEEPESRKWNLWSYIDARDAAQAIRKALEYTSPGFEAFIIANPDTVMKRPTSVLIEQFLPGVPLRHPIEGRAALLSSDKARRMLGFEPRHSWLADA